mmetsp:Transcript_1989/g.2805  ORF Transcript_1989/g.2805 Transcript_1989/m.2805 type:complete len:201 (-) Transcript_1989:620-1222(-)
MTSLELASGFTPGPLWLPPLAAKRSPATRKVVLRSSVRKATGSRAATSSSSTRATTTPLVTRSRRQRPDTTPTSSPPSSTASPSAACLSRPWRRCATTPTSRSSKRTRWSLLLPSVRGALIAPIRSICPWTTPTTPRATMGRVWTRTSSTPASVGPTTSLATVLWNTSTSRETESTTTATDTAPTSRALSAGRRTASPRG